MSKKHFQALAEMVSGLRGEVDERSRIRFAHQLALLCEHYNDRFDYRRFITACDALVA